MWARVPAICLQPQPTHPPTPTPPALLAGMFYFDASYRPVPLEMQFVGVSERNVMARMNLMDEICYQKASSLRFGWSEGGWGGVEHNGMAHMHVMDTVVCWTRWWRFGLLGARCLVGRLFGWLVWLVGCWSVGCLAVWLFVWGVCRRASAGYQNQATRICRPDATGHRLAQERLPGHGVCAQARMKGVGG